MSLTKAAPHLFVILGALGDLARRKLLPALYRLSARGDLSAYRVLGVDTEDKLDDNGFRAWADKLLTSTGEAPSADISQWCAQYLHYFGAGKSPDYSKLAARIEALEREHHLPGNRVFYLALPSGAVPTVVAGLGEAGLSRGPGWTRLVLEKPFGWDLASAQKLNLEIHRYFEESQIYRTDHFLGKETVQNLLVFRFGNTFFEHLWSREHIESVEITVAESLGVEGRAAYYERAGALRDMVQNHLTQLMTLVAMEAPAAFKSEAIRNEKIKVLEQITPIRPENVVLGQYTSGRIGREKVVGYREEPGVSPNSHTATFAALKLEVANWRWKGVPFHLRTGKRLPTRCTQIVIRYHCAPVSIFHPFESSCDIQPNILVIILQPDEGFKLLFQVKAPGQPFRLTTQPLHFRYAEAFGQLPDAYETIILDLLHGDQTLFVCDREVEHAWRLYNGLLDKDIPVYPYPAGTWGPPAIDKLGASWLHRSP